MSFFFAHLRSCLPALLGLLAACSGYASPDGGAPRDASTWDVRLIDAHFEDAPIAPRDAPARDGLVPMSDAGPSWRCPMDACDPRRPGMGCPDGACVLGPEGEPACVATTGSGGAGEPCMTGADCAAGLGCFTRADSDEATCTRICCPGDRDACGPDLRCEPAGTTADGTPTAWGRCVPPRSCDVLDSEGTCAPGEGCYIVDADRTTECRVSGHSGQGDTCVHPEDCAPGFFCGGLRIRVCSRICALEGMPSCPPDEGRCVAYAYSPEGTGTCTASPSGM